MTPNYNRTNEDQGQASEHSETENREYCYFLSNKIATCYKDETG